MLKNELEKHKQAVKQLADVQEKLKKQKDGLPEVKVTSICFLLSANPPTSSEEN